MKAINKIRIAKLEKLFLRSDFIRIMKLKK